MKYTGRAVLACAVLSILPLVVAEAQAGSAAPASLASFPDFLSVRSEFLSALITAAPSRALAFKTVYRDSPAGRIRISVENAGASFYVLFLRERDGSFPVGTRGNVVIKRETATGYVKRVVWFLSDDGASFVSLVPKNERTVVDYAVAGSLSRGSYSVSRLIYYFFTNSFAYLHDATRSGLDWSLTLGAPGPAAAASFAAELSSGKPSGAAAALLRAASDFSEVGGYLAVAGVPGSAPAEETPSRSEKAATFADMRDPAFVAVPAWTEARGLALESASIPILAGMASQSAFIALVSGSSHQPPRRLAIVPFRNAYGLSVITAVDAETRQPVDYAALVSALPGASVRLFRVPLPAVR